MPIVGDIERPERRTLVDENGLPVARYVHVQRDGRSIADLLELEVPVQRAVPYVTAELRGMRVGGSEELGRALVAAGGRAHRHSHAYTHDLVVLPECSTAYRLTPVDRPSGDLVPAFVRAFGPGHPDHRPADEAAPYLQRLVAEGLLPASGLAIVDDRVVAAILIGTLTDAPAPFGGPWVMEVFSVARGAGRGLLQRALHRSEGSLGLAVTEGNPAVRVYESLGFRRTLTVYSVDL